MREHSIRDSDENMYGHLKTGIVDMSETPTDQHGTKIQVRSQLQKLNSG